MTEQSKLISNLSMMGIISQLPISLINEDGSTIFCSYLEEHHYWPPEATTYVINSYKKCQVPYPMPYMYTLNLDYMMGVIAYTDSKYILLGPANTRKLSLEDTIAALSPIISHKHITHFYSLFERSVPTDSMRFASILALIANDLHNASFTPQEIIKHNFDKPIVDTFVHPRPYIEEHEVSVQTIQMLLHGISSDIATGNMDALKKQWLSHSVSNIRTASHDREDMLLFFLPFYTFMFNGALRGGVDIHICHDKYLVQLERFKKVKNSPEALVELERASYEYCELVMQDSKNNLIPEICNQCINYINEHIHEKITSSDLAYYCGIHRNKLYDIFRANFDMTVSEYIERERLRRTLVYLESSNYSLSEIAQTMGYTSQSHFTKIFKKHFNCTPGQFLKELAR